MKLSKKLLIAGLIVGALSSVSYQVQAQSTCSSAANLRACIAGGNDVCRDAWSCSSDRAEGVSVQDIINDASEACCSKPTKAEKACLKRIAGQLKDAASEAPSFVKRILKEGRSEVTALSKNGCDTGSQVDL